MSELYDTIGRGYAAYRRPDVRVAAALMTALGDAASVVSVGAGAGSYEPCDRRVVAVEPASTMIAQRPTAAAPVVRAYGTALPFVARAFDASLAVLTLHHWSDQLGGLRELRRVARRRVVLLTWEPDGAPFWLLDYFPEIATIDGAQFLTMAQLRRCLGPLTVQALPVPHDCTDGFLGAYWRRPEVYLDAGARRAISTFAKLRDAEAGLARLRDDLASGEWRRRYGHLLGLAELDLGYRLVVAAA